MSPSLSPLVTVISIRTGYPFRSRIDNDPNGDVAVIQMRDIDYDTHRLTGDLYHVSGHDPKDEHLLVDGDVIFVSKGANNIAVHLDRVAGKTIAAPTFFVLRSTSDRLLSSFLAWFMNSRSVQQRLREQARGSAIPIVTKSMIEKLQIPLPPIEMQQAIVEIDRLAATERRLVKTIQDKYALLIESYLHTN